MAAKRSTRSTRRKSGSSSETKEKGEQGSGVWAAVKRHPVRVVGALAAGLGAAAYLGRSAYRGRAHGHRGRDA